mmetsp:Transcript_55062/g.115214  ORF Transcript_55062/g.115214 Transcript_55062/m.115214 type:complete len:119 (-) Transcript_55062:229-585(-)
MSSATNQELEISEWYLYNVSDIDVSVGLLKTNPSVSRHNLLNIMKTPVSSGPQIWAVANKDGRSVSLTGRTVSSVSEYVLRTSVGGSAGYSGLGYVNIDGMLTVIQEAFQSSAQRLDT